jgi:hypothetical protein
MTFSECLEQVILPTFERLKKEHEEGSPNHPARIRSNGTIPYIEFTFKKDDRALSWGLKVTKSRDEEGGLYLAGNAHYSTSSKYGAEHLTTEYIAIDKLTPTDIENTGRRARALFASFAFPEWFQSRQYFECS